MSRTARWVYDPHRGGRPIPDAVRRRLAERLLSHAERCFAGRYGRLDVRFRGQFCYLDLYRDPSVPGGRPRLPGWARAESDPLEPLPWTPLHLCRLRYLGDEDRCSFAFFDYASELYEPAAFASGDMLGSPEDALALSAAFYLEC